MPTRPRPRGSHGRSPTAPAPQKRCSPKYATDSRRSSRADASPPFAGGYWSHPAYRLTLEVNLLAVNHCLDALDFQRDYVRVRALPGGKNPRPQTCPDGGMAVPIDLGSETAIKDATLQELRQLLLKGRDFVRQAYLPGLMAITAAYLEWLQTGRGLGN
ncbi:nickel-dependent hydrogenase large subunit [Streptomyces sp. MMG1533]|uniref:nickel-dependent hydrogenase large subunit n=1 Tax=Streptomyces sp. MMG1533 TaxID=1415546 RepID=UPI0006AF4CDC|nr:nickel-dependent hydrogenase large subunit [Streptomyces sp. MMG1533]